MVHNGNLLILLVYVDDILVMGDDVTLINQLIRDLDTHFSLKHLGEITIFSASRRRCLRHALNLLSRKTSRICSLRLIFLTTNLPPLLPVRVTNFQLSTILRLITRPDIAFSVNKLSQFLQNPSQNHWQACKRVLRHISLPHEACRGRHTFSLGEDPVSAT